MRLALLPLLAVSASRIDKFSSLSLKDSTRFRIAVPSDLHFGELPESYGPIQDTQSALILRSMLRLEKPDLVVLNGDLLTGEDVLASSPTDSLQVLFEPMVEANVQWASTYGNHDSKYNLQREAIFRIESGYAQSLTRRGPPETDGLTSYYIPLLSNHTPIVILWFFDSRGESTQSSNLDNIPNYVSKRTVAWFLKTSADLSIKYGKSLKHLVFVHIPPLPFYDAQQAFFVNNEDSNALFPGLNQDVPLAIQSESPLSNYTYDGHDQPFIDALLLRGVHSVWTGHDHGNSWCSTWPDSDTQTRQGQQEDQQDASIEKHINKPFLCFCKHTGIGGYGPWQRGTRMLDIHYEGGRMEVDTWVRMDDDSIVNRVSLNDTYGHDQYPVFDVVENESEFSSRLKQTAEDSVMQ